MTRAGTASKRTYDLLRDIVALGLPARVGRTVVSVKAKIVPIPIRPQLAAQPYISGHWNMLGAGAALEAELKSAAPIWRLSLADQKVVVDLPSGTKLHQSGFRRARSPFSKARSGHCPKEVVCGPRGECSGWSLRARRAWKRKRAPAFAPGTSSRSTQKAPHPRPWKSSHRKLLDGPTAFRSDVHGAGALVLTSQKPRTPRCSRQGQDRAAYKRGKKLISYGTVPKKCPRRLQRQGRTAFLSGETARSTRGACPSGRRGVGGRR